MHTSRHTTQDSPRRRVGRKRAVLAAVSLLLLAACGEDDKSTSSSGAPTSTAPAASVTPDSASTTDSTATTDAATDSSAVASTSGPNTPAPKPLAEKTKLRITLPVKIEGFADLILANAKGEFTKENLDVEIIAAPGSEALVMIGTDRTDLISGSPNAGFFNGLKSGLDICWVLPNYAPNPDSIAGLWIRNEVLGDDKVPQAEEIKGITVALGTLGLGAPSAQPVSIFLQNIGLKLSDINISNVQGADMVSALENKAIQAGVVLDPFNQLVEQGGYATFVQPFLSYSIGGYIAGKIRDNHEVMDAFTRAMVRTRRTYLQGDYHSNDDVVSALATEMGVDTSTLTKNLPLLWDPDASIDPRSVTDMQKMWIEGGVLDFPAPFPAEQVIDQSSVQRVLAGG